VVGSYGLADVLALEEFDGVLRDRSRSLPATEMLSKVGPMCEKILKFGRDTNREAGAQRIVEAIRAVDTGANKDTRARNVREEISKLYTRDKTPDRSVDVGFLCSDMNARLRQASALKALSVDAIIAEQKRALGDLYEYAELLRDAAFGLAPASNERVKLYRGTKMTRAALDAYSKSVGEVILLPCFTSWSEDVAAATRFPQTLEQGEANALIELNSIGRPRVGGPATEDDHTGGEVLLPSSSMVHVASTEIEISGVTVQMFVHLTDLAVLRASVGPKLKLRFRVEGKAKKHVLEVPVGSTVGDVLKLVGDSLGRPAVAIHKGTAELPRTEAFSRYFRSATVYTIKVQVVPPAVVQPPATL
jgi:hypothetical protein